MGNGRGHSSGSTYFQPDFYGNRKNGNAGDRTGSYGPYVCSFIGNFVIKPFYCYGRSYGKRRWLFLSGSRDLPWFLENMLLLSGGIDSPVAGFMVAKRGVKIDAVYFHAPPYTSERAKQKVVDLAKLVARYSGPIYLHVINFTEIQLAIYESARTMS